MTDIANHVRIFEPEPSDDFVTKRTAAIKDIADRFAKKRPSAAVLQSASELANAVDVAGGMPTGLAADIEAALTKQSPAFVPTGQDLQKLVCALMGASQFLASATPGAVPLSIADVLAAGLWSALSFQVPRSEPKLETLRSELIGRARVLVMATAGRVRHRSSVPDFDVQFAEGGDLPALVEALKTGAAKTIEPLRTNAALDREEIDLLWWVLGEWSTLLDRRFSSVPTLAAACASGLEAGVQLRRLPGDAHRYLVLRNVRQADPIGLVALLAELGDDRSRLAAAFSGNTTLSACPAVFPLMTALTTGQATGPAAELKRAVDEWAARALLEAAILHVTAPPGAVV